MSQNRSSRIPSSTLSRAAAFLPLIAEANNVLLERIQTGQVKPEEVNVIDSLKEDNGEDESGEESDSEEEDDRSGRVEMTVGLGVFDMLTAENGVSVRSRKVVGDEDGSITEQNLIVPVPGCGTTPSARKRKRGLLIEEIGSKADIDGEEEESLKEIDHTKRCNNTDSDIKSI
ncbi:hypothetical protein BJ742DRAFT_776884 [Cladochytrium replicatum]|nr:hypothetical protein BJ742DRAFT_776884 [Cladochytrium replicatum]